MKNIDKFKLQIVILHKICIVYHLKVTSFPITLFSLPFLTCWGQFEPPEPY